MVDEYGGVSGIVTIEDLLEEIVGEIQDEFDAEEPEIQRIGESEFVLDAGMPIDELNEYLGVNVVGNGSIPSADSSSTGWERFPSRVTESTTQV